YRVQPCTYELLHLSVRHLYRYFRSIYLRIRLYHNLTLWCKVHRFTSLLFSEEPPSINVSKTLPTSLPSTVYGILKRRLPLSFAYVFLISSFFTCSLKALIPPKNSIGSECCLPSYSINRFSSST